jgi:hypothetical protein
VNWLYLSQYLFQFYAHAELHFGLVHQFVAIHRALNLLICLLLVRHSVKFGVDFVSKFGHKFHLAQLLCCRLVILLARDASAFEVLESAVGAYLCLSQIVQEGCIAQSN